MHFLQSPLLATALALLTISIHPDPLLAEEGKKEAPPTEAKKEKKKPIVTTKVYTTVIGTDGKVLSNTEGTEGKDLNQIIKEATGAALSEIGDLHLDELLKSAEGSITVIGPDGKVTTKELEGTGGLAQIIQDALGEVDLEGIEKKAIAISKSSDTQYKALQKDMDGIKAELAEQRKLLEKILKRLK